MVRRTRQLVLLLAGFLTPAGSVTPAGAQAVITSVVRKVAHQLPGRAWQRSKVGTSLGAGASVRTGKRAKCEVKLGPNIIRLSERSEITLRGNQVALNRGRLFGNFKRDTIIKGGKTTATIKGTKVVFWLEGGVLHAECLEGGPVTLVLPKLDERGNPMQNAQGQPEEIEIMITAGERATLPTDGIRPQTPPPAPTPGPPPSPKYPDPEDFVQSTPDTPRFIDASVGKPTSDFDFQSGTATLVTPGARDSVTIKLDRVTVDQSADSGGDESQQQAATVILTQEIQNVIVNPPSAPSGSELTPPVQTGELEVQLRQPPVTRAPKQGFMAPRLDGNTFLYKRDGSRATYGLRFAGSGLYNDVFWQFALSPQTLFDGHTDVDVSDAFTVFRNPDTFGEITLGRQRFLKGPVQNVTTGTLITQEIMDAVTWSPPIRRDPRWSLDLSLIQDAFPFDVGGNQGGYHIRAAYSDQGGVVGFNLLRVNAVPVSPSGRMRIGVTVDASIPLLPEKLDMYGEFGSDIFGENLRTFGWYFPHLYDKYNIDAYLETTKRMGPAPGITVLRMYYNIGTKFTALVTADHVQDRAGINLGVGLVAKLFK